MYNMFYVKLEEYLPHLFHKAEVWDFSKIW